MAKNDMEVIAYKILTYIYKCNKKGIRPTTEDLIRDCSLHEFSESYWTQIVKELIKKGYLAGVEYVNVKPSGFIQLKEDVAITLDGVQYLEENSRMQAVKEHFGNAFEAVITHAIELLMMIK